MFEKNKFFVVAAGEAGELGAPTKWGLGAAGGAGGETYS